jgi:two-component system alkaline phosphatase synthesis response regulator PhoP
VARILIVDDEESDRLLAEAILERAGHEVLLAKDGEEALSMCREGPVDVVVTDLQMPKVHGFELITALRDTDRPPPIIAVSGTGHEQLEIADALGAKFTMSKPVNPDDLLAAVEQVLRFPSK